MYLLALDTSTEACSAALCLNGQLLERSELAPRRHGERILPMIDALLAEAGIGKRQLDAIAVGRGPGSFTGVRLGVSLVQGMALGLDLPVVAVSSLAALALEAPNDDATILAAIDARMSEVYVATFRRCCDGLIELLDEERVGKADAFPISESAAWCGVGNGWQAYREELLSLLPSMPRNILTDRFPQARNVARLGVPLWAVGKACSAEQLQPVYLRNKVALTRVERAALR